ncbi:hypothetical protein EVAR_59488_1 [Eumeta japonica]|uniref:Uncharacterized protein n=1 Tax=Eumeta variegata TaxID=151549 RepID=A0A4C1YGW4_EUMVA|nr:hypothetical protein EVAR_59488_1 [Eumeta japonica]
MTMNGGCRELLAAVTWRGRASRGPAAADRDSVTVSSSESAHRDALAPTYRRNNSTSGVGARATPARPWCDWFVYIGVYLSSVSEDRVFTSAGVSKVDLAYVRHTRSLLAVNKQT